MCRWDCFAQWPIVWCSVRNGGGRIENENRRDFKSNLLFNWLAFAILTNLLMGAVDSNAMIRSVGKFALLFNRISMAKQSTLNESSSTSTITTATAALFNRFSINSNGNILEFHHVVDSVSFAC